GSPLRSRLSQLNKAGRWRNCFVTESRTTLSISMKLGRVSVALEVLRKSLYYSVRYGEFHAHEWLSNDKDSVCRLPSCQIQCHRFCRSGSTHRVSAAIQSLICCWPAALATRKWSEYKTPSGVSWSGSDSPASPITMECGRRFTPLWLKPRVLHPPNSQAFGRCTSAACIRLFG